MNFRRYFYVGKSYFSRTPPYVILFVTGKCNARCDFCFYWKTVENPDVKNELTLEEIKKISKNFGDILFLTISGGEPFLREDLPEIIRTFRVNNNLQFASIPTNGFFSKRTKKMTETILKQNPDTFFHIRMSLDGIGKDHDKVRKVEGLFEKYKETYKMLSSLRERYKNFNLEATTVYSYYNKGKVKGVYQFVKKNFDFDGHSLGLVRGTVKSPIVKAVSLDEFKDLASWLEKETIAKKNIKGGFIVRALRAVKLLNRDVQFESLSKNKMIVPCLAGKRMIVIRENGFVDPCEIWTDKGFGNLRNYNYDIKKILAEKKTKRFSKFIKKTKCHCTFECAIQSNITYSPSIWPRLLKKLIKVR